MPNQLLTAKKETTPGIAAANAATDAVWAMNVQHKVIGQRVVLSPSKPGFGADVATDVVGVFAELTFDVQMAASGTAGTAPKWGVLHKAASWSEGTDVATVTYGLLANPETSDSLTLAWSDEGRQHKLVYARGKVDLKCTALAIPIWSYTFRGVLVPVTARTPAVAADGVFTNWTDTKAIAQGRTTFSLGAVPMVLRDFTITGGDNIKTLDLPGQKGVFLKGPRPFTGSIKANVPDLAQYNPEARFIDQAQAVAALVHETAPGKIVTINARVQLDAPTWSKEDGFDVFTSQVFLVPSTTFAADEMSAVLT